MEVEKGEHRVFRIDVGNKPNDEVLEYLEKIQVQLRDQFHPDTSIFTPMRPFKDRFDQHLADFAKGYGPRVLSRFKKFIQDKLENRLSGHDTAFAAHGSTKKNLFHCQLVQGKVIVIYEQAGDTLYLYDVVDHFAYDTPNKQSKLIRYISNITARDLKEIPVSSDQTPTLDKISIEKELYELAAIDATIVLDFINGSNDLLLVFLEDYSKDHQATLEAFGGHEKFVELLKLVLKRIGL